MIFAPIPAQVCDGGYEKNVMKKEGESLVTGKFVPRIFANSRGLLLRN